MHKRYAGFVVFAILLVMCVGVFLLKCGFSSKTTSRYRSVFSDGADDAYFIITNYVAAPMHIVTNGELYLKTADIRKSCLFGKYEYYACSSDRLDSYAQSNPKLSSLWPQTNVANLGVCWEGKEPEFTYTEGESD